MTLLDVVPTGKVFVLFLVILVIMLIYRKLFRKNLSEDEFDSIVKIEPEQKLES